MQNSLIQGVCKMKNELFNPHKSSIADLNANLVAVLAYLIATVVSWIPVVRYVAWLAPLVLFYMEKQSNLVKFHALQAFVLNLASSALYFIITVVIAAILGVGSITTVTALAAAGIAGILSLITFLVSLAFLVLTIIAMIGAYGYKETHIPIVGDLAENLAIRLGQSH